MAGPEFISFPYISVHPAARPLRHLQAHLHTSECASPWTCTATPTYIHRSMGTRTHERTLTQACTHIHTLQEAYMHAHICRNMHTHTPRSMHTYTQAHIYRSTHAHACTHTSTHVYSQLTRSHPETNSICIEPLLLPQLNPVYVQLDFYSLPHGAFSVYMSVCHSLNYAAIAPWSRSGNVR